jgi:hypothetical protein
MAVSVGSRIILESEKVGQSGRSGIVEEVLAEMPLRLRVRWDDGRTSVLSPTAGAARFAGDTATKTKKRR